MEKVKVIYIAGSGRSGSTLIDRVIYSSPKVFSVGELKFLKQYIARRDENNPSRPEEKFKDLNEDYLSESPFWGEIVKAVKENDYQVFDRYYKIDKKVVFSILLGQSFIIKKFNDFELYKLIMKKAKEVKGEQVEYIIDSSKSLKKLLSLYQDKRIDLRIVHVVRDARGHIASLEKGGFDWIKLFMLWFKNNFLISVFLGRFLNKDIYVSLSYDDFCLNHESYIRIFNKKFNLDIDEDKFLDVLNSQLDFAFAGNTMRRKKIDEIRHDEKWKIKWPKWKQIIISIISNLPNSVWVYKNK